jgi:dTDP-4-dehydrorhamnose reductase
MKVVVLGGTGLLGKELQSINSEFEYYGSELDITNTLTLHKKLDELNPDVILHLAAIKDSLEVESNPIKSIETNIIGTANISIWCIENNCRLVYVSTDYVYNGDSKIKHKETSPVRPENLYSNSKLGGECSVKFVKNHCIIRTSFGDSKFPYESAYDNLFVSKDYVDVIAPMILNVTISNYTGIINVGTHPKSMLEYAKRRNEIKIIKHTKHKNFVLNTNRYDKLFGSK